MNEGLEGGCPICERRKKVSNQERNLRLIRKKKDKDRKKFIDKMRKQLGDFNMTTTGSDTVDRLIKESE